MATTTGTTYTDASLTAGSYTYTVTALDGSGNESAASNAVVAAVTGSGSVVTATNMLLSSIANCATTSGMTGHNMAIATATTPAPPIGTSLIAGTITASSSSTYLITPNTSGIVAGTVYTFLASIRPAAAGNAHITVIWGDTAGDAFAQAVSPDVAIPANTWTQLSFTATAPSSPGSATKVAIQTTMSTGNVAGNALAFAQLGLYASSTVNTWS